MALVAVNGGGGWGTLTTTQGNAEKPLPSCLARLVQAKNQVGPKCGQSLGVGASLVSIVGGKERIEFE
jgi:hypothetical protein